MAGPSPSLVLALAVAWLSCASAAPPPAGKPVVAQAPSPPPECTPRLCFRPGFACRGGQCLPVRTGPYDFREDTDDPEVDEAIRQHRHDGPDTY